MTTLPDDPRCRLYARAAFDRTLAACWRRGQRAYPLRPQRLGWKEVDLFMLFEGVRLGGGIEEVRARRQFQPIAGQLRLSRSATNAGHGLRVAYERWLQPCEQQLTEAVDRAGGAHSPIARQAVPGEHVHAAVQSRLMVNEMEEDEVAAFPEHAMHCTDLYLDVRNHIVRCWRREPRTYLEADAVAAQLPREYTALVRACHRFLHCRGNIVFGCVPLPPPPRPNDPVASAAGATVVVVGAGIAGLGAARHLRHLQAASSVVVLEARDRLGGRIWTQRERLSGAAVDAGAMIITGAQQNPLMLLAREQLCLPVLDTAAACPLYADGGRPVDAAADQLAEQRYNDILAETVQLRQVVRDADRHALGDTFKRVQKQRLVGASTLTRRLVRWHVANLEYGCGATLDQLSLSHWDQDDPFAFEGEHCLVRGGLSQVVEALAAELDVRLQHRVTRVAWTSRGVRVCCANGAVFDGDYVVIALPLGVLRDSRAIAFQPPLPPWKREALRGIGNGRLEKVVLRFAAPFWLGHQNGHAGDAVAPTVCSFGVLCPAPEVDADDGRFYMFWDLTAVAGAPVLAAMVPAAAAGAMESWSDEAILQACLQRLRQVFPGAPQPLDALVTRWSADDASRGAYSYVPVGSSGEAYDRAAECVDERLFFAGEHTCRTHPTTAGGAYLSGLRCAGEVARTRERHLAADAAAAAAANGEWRGRRPVRRAAKRAADTLKAE
ncbi:hypothetical protein CDCA_CDCA15G4092 [Cyanidium caldarium]|uniref:Amine oxidase n=1 Tax=Cyanidium caldarium TaxID=2771 RepID=A0AAV9J0F9_CYACA|nr:hypothetical protein CDCA_CDCA15G4092 [Cyanidium caldarium]